MKPHRQRKHDRLTFGDASRDEVAIDHAVAPFDRAARAADTTWGVDRLIELVSPETAKKFGRTLASLNEAIAANDVERATDRAAACVRGYDALDREARAAGHIPPKSGVIVCELDGWKFGVLPDHRLWPQAAEEFPELRVYTIREIGLLLQKVEQKSPIGAVKDAFPGAQIGEVRSRSTLPRDRNPNDIIPF